MLLRLCADALEHICTLLADLSASAANLILIEWICKHNNQSNSSCIAVTSLLVLFSCSSYLVILLFFLPP